MTATPNDTEERRWLKAMEGMTPQQREAFMAEAAQRAKDQFFARVAQMKKRPRNAHKREARP